MTLFPVSFFKPLARPWHRAAVLSLCTVMAALTGTASAADRSVCPSEPLGSIDDVTSAWQCDPDDDAEVTVTSEDSGAAAEADARLMLVVGVSSGAGWLARGLHKD